MKVVAKAAVLGLAGLSALGVAGCNRGGGSGGTTTVIQQPGGGGAGIVSSPSPSAAPAGVAPINDQKELCHQILVKTRGLSTAVQAFWNIVTTPGGWSFTNQKTQDAVSRVEKETEQAFPALDTIVGKGIPAETADAANDYLQKIKIFSNSITEQRENEVLDPAASNYGHAKDKLESVCSAAG